MIDLHFHCLPSVDDGPSGLDESVQMCRQAAADGCDVIVATPHQNHHLWSNDRPESLHKRLVKLREAVGETPRLYLGAEIRVGPDLLERLGDSRLSGLLPLAGSRYLLLEFPHSGPELDPEELVHELKLAGWRPILAHPEVIAGLGEDLDLLHRLISAGSYLQVTAMSLTGGYGSRIRNRALRMLDHGLIHFVASDAHGVTRRPPGLGEARDLIAARSGDETAWAVTTANPRAVLADKPLSETHLVA